MVEAAINITPREEPGNIGNGLNESLLTDVSSQSMDCETLENETQHDSFYDGIFPDREEDSPSEQNFDEISEDDSSDSDIGVAETAQSTLDFIPCPIQFLRGAVDIDSKLIVAENLLCFRPEAKTRLLMSEYLRKLF